VGWALTQSNGLLAAVLAALVGLAVGGVLSLVVLMLSMRRYQQGGGV